MYGLVEKLAWSVHWLIMVGWSCASCGLGLLTLLGSERSIAADILLNLLSGFGIGILLSSLALSAKSDADDGRARQTPMILIYMRYLGSASGVVITGLLFQRALRHNLSSKGFGDEARELVKHATTLVDSIGAMPSSSDKIIIVQAVSDALSTVWVVLSVASGIMFLLSSIMVLFRAKQRQDSRCGSERAAPDPELPEVDMGKDFRLESPSSSCSTSPSPTFEIGRKL